MGLSVSTAGGSGRGPDVTRNNPGETIYLGDSAAEGSWRIIVDALGTVKVEQLVSGAWTGSEIIRDEIYLTRDLALMFQRDGEFVVHGRRL